MNAYLRGCLLGISVSILSVILLFTMNDYPAPTNYIIIVISFLILVAILLKSNNLYDFFTVFGIGTLEFIVLSLVLLKIFHGNIMLVFVYGFLGSVIGLIISLVLTVFPKKEHFKIKEENLMPKKNKIKLLAYAFITFLSFTYLILPEAASISIPIFFILQFIMLLFIIPSRKSLWLFVPIFLISLNSFISTNSILRTWNFILIIVLYALMFVKIDFWDTSTKFISNVLIKILEPFKYIKIPFSWCSELSKGKADIIKRVFIAILVTVPVAVIICVFLSSADIIFSNTAKNTLVDFTSLLNFNMIFKSLYGIIVGIYVFGLLYSSHITKNTEGLITKTAKKGDLIILNILLCSILVLYTIFVVIQFKYLFAGSQLPDGLTYTTYARKGFFELLFLTGVNIFIILLTVHLSKDNKRFWGTLTKYLCCYLCVVTIILLASSFYRMWLYVADDGLTRLRFMVIGFLIFELIGLIFTFVYILKPKFNIAAIYCCIALCYYVLLNLVPMDYFIAKNQIDRHFKNFDSGINYTLSLSADAAPQIKRLYESELESDKAKNFISEKQLYYSEFQHRWQRFNLSIHLLNKQ